MGGFLTVIGSVMFAGVAGVLLAEIAMIHHLGASDLTVATIKALDNSGPIAVAYIGVIVAVVGLLVLSFGLARSGVVARPLAALLAVGAVVQDVSLTGVGGLTTLIAGAACMFVALAPIGAKILAESDRAWEHPPLRVGVATAHPQG